MANPNSDTDLTCMFMQRGDSKRANSPTDRAESESRTTTQPAEVITVKDFFDFMKTAYQVYEHLEGEEEAGAKIDWEELTKLTVLNHEVGPQERALLSAAAAGARRAPLGRSEAALRTEGGPARAERGPAPRRSRSEGARGRAADARVEMLGAWTEANLTCKLNDVINEGILDSILPYLVGYKKPSKTTSVYAPVVRKTPSASSADVGVKKPASFGGFVHEKESRDRLGRRKSSLAAGQERAAHQQDGEVQIHVCDEAKGLRKEFRCAQRLLLAEMGYFADVTAGQRLEDMDISVHCDIQIFEWLMRWVKRDSILVADWPLLDAHNVVPVLVSASFLQMEPLLHDCLAYCHAHLSDVVRTASNLACLSDALLARLAAMYTNAELEAVRDRKDKIQSRLYCKMILALAEPVPEPLRGHHASLATLFKCARCGKLLARHVAERVPCQPACMRVDRRGRVLAAHARDPAWSLAEYAAWLHGELRSWRRVYWRLWADCHFLRCQLCDAHFPAYQLEWCSHHEQPAHMYARDGRTPLPAGRHPCCGERAYRFEALPRNTGCQFREHAPDESAPGAAAVLELCARFRDVIAMRPPHLVFPDRLTRLVPRDAGEESGGRLQCKEVFWWEGIQLAPPRQPLGLLGKLYTSNLKFNPNARPASPALGPARPSALALPAGPPAASPDRRRDRAAADDKSTGDTDGGRSCGKPGAGGAAGGGAAGGEATGGGAAGVEAAGGDSERSEGSSDSGASDEDAPRRPRARSRAQPPRAAPLARRGGGGGGGRAAGRVWLAAQSARTNQDGQRRFEERAAAHMRAALAQRHHHAAKPRAPPGGVFVRLEAEWRERQGAGGGGAGARRGAALGPRRHAPLKYK